MPTLLRAAGVSEFGNGFSSITVTGLDYDSRRVEPGSLFFAFTGAKADGNDFARDAAAKGAVAVVSESPAPAGFPIPWIVVPHGRRALSLIARAFYAQVAPQLLLTGATGTNGKTTTCMLHDSMLRAAGYITALVGTIEYHLAGEVRKAVNTTPESLDLYRLYNELIERGGRHATMEVSSHALALGRVNGFRFETALWTNFTRDHLDFHGAMEKYFEAKCELFRGQDAPPPRHAVLNADDEWAARIPLSPETQVTWYGLGPKANLRAENIRMGFDGLRFDIVHDSERFRAESQLAGRINVYNILAAFGAARANGVPVEAILRGIADRRAVAGRFERVDEGQPFLVVVDYAHTDDALRNTIQTARSLTSGRVITLFGCGGDRDRKKRPLMGQAAGELSDYVVLTSDNPRSEDPLTIINDALVGLRRTDTPHQIEADRACAIRLAIGAANPGDVVLLAGKGHEDYQVLKDRTIHFDDREVARQVLREALRGSGPARSNPRSNP
ncbi:MAG: UDP-N-acetylmuramoyl-L-alanyl-D-glutamate--2,6-diaminopimelate ligase [Bryobacterales bacterium]|nr:UDP-N-acetylmuramoyl-L-alanyl-D-glutamate--2,6-diaminopimelate ligase [Bryobacterales bacterium]